MRGNDWVLRILPTLHIANLMIASADAAAYSVLLLDLLLRY